MVSLINKYYIAQANAVMASKAQGRKGRAARREMDGHSQLPIMHGTLETKGLHREYS